DHQGVAEPAADLGHVGADHPPAVGPPDPAAAVKCQCADGVAGAQRVQAAQRVGRHAAPRAHRPDLRCPLQHRHPSPGPGQRDRGGQSADARADHHGVLRSGHLHPPSTSVVNIFYTCRGSIEGEQLAERGRGRERIELIARTAVQVTARKGLRGLTHRAVDRAAGLPDGSTSYHARTRARLLEITLEHMAAEEERALAAFFADAPPTRDETARLFARFVHASVHASAERTLARFELALEASRRPELRRIYNRTGARFRRTATDTMRGPGSPAPPPRRPWRSCTSTPRSCWTPCSRPTSGAEPSPHRRSRPRPEHPGPPAPPTAG